MAIYAFRTSNYALNIIRYGSNRLTTRDGFVGTAAGYYTPVQQYTATNFGKDDIDNAISMTWINDQEYQEILNLLVLPVPAAPVVTLDDVRNIIVGITSKMEYSIDDSAYVVYNISMPPSLPGDRSVKVRISAVPYVNHTGLITSLVCHKNPVTPPAPTLVFDDTTNTITGMKVGMEYNYDATGYLAYEATAFSVLQFNGYHSLRVRVAAEGINPYGVETDYTFTNNPVQPITPAAPNVTIDDELNVIYGIDNTMEYNLDNTTEYVAFLGSYLASVDLSGEHTLLVRVKAEGINLAGLVTSLTFTTNPAVAVTPNAPTLSFDDVNNRVLGMTTKLEYKLDDAEYIPYEENLFNELDFSGDHTFLARVSAEGINPVSADTTIIFTTNPLPVTPGFTSVTMDDGANTVTGLQNGMEYSLDSAAYVVYDESTYITLDLSGEHVLNVRFCAEGINPVGPDTVLTYTTN